MRRSKISLYGIPFHRPTEEYVGSQPDWVGEIGFMQLYLEAFAGSWRISAVIPDGNVHKEIGVQWGSTARGAIRLLFNRCNAARQLAALEGWVFFSDGSPVRRAEILGENHA